MTGRSLIQTTGARVTKRRGKRIVSVAPRFRAWARRSRHQLLLMRALRDPRVSINLIEATSPDELARVGLVYDAELGGWTHPNGDEAAERVLLGIDPPPERMPDVPDVLPVVEVEARQVRAGEYRWTEEPGTYAKVYHRGKRLA